MVRPPHPVGTSGNVRSYRTASGWRSRTTVRDYDGKTREIQRAGRTKAEAQRKLAGGPSEPLAYRDSAARRQAVFQQPGVLERTYRGPLGAASGAEQLQIRLYDLLATAGIWLRPLGNPSSCRKMWPSNRWRSCASN